MRLAILLIVFSLAACRGAPVKPEVELALMDYPRDEAIAGVGGSTTIRRDPLKDWDKSTMFKPEDWAKVDAYIKQMEAYAKELERRLKQKECINE